LRTTNSAALNNWSTPTTGKAITETHTETKTKADNNNTSTDAPGLHDNTTVCVNYDHGTGAH
jgi:hypothetical protein